MDSRRNSFNGRYGDTTGKYQAQRHGDSSRPLGQDFVSNPPGHDHTAGTDHPPTRNDTSSSSQSKMENKRGDLIHEISRAFDDNLQTMMDAVKQEIIRSEGEQWSQNGRPQRQTWMKSVKQKWMESVKQKWMRWVESVKEEYMEREKERYMKSVKEEYMKRGKEEYMDGGKTEDEWEKSGRQSREASWRGFGGPTSERLWEKSGRQSREASWRGFGGPTSERLEESGGQFGGPIWEQVCKQPLEDQWERVGGEIYQRLSDDSQKNVGQFRDKQMESGRQEFMERKQQEFMKKEAKIYIHEKMQQVKNSKGKSLKRAEWIEWLKSVNEQWAHTRKEESENKWESFGKQSAEKEWEQDRDAITSSDTSSPSQGRKDGNSKPSNAIDATTDSGRDRSQDPPTREFIIGQENSTESICNLKSINEIPIAKLEARMRPGKDSHAGFLGRNESLIEVLAKDNETVREMKSTHQDLAGFLRLFSYSREKGFKRYDTVRYCIFEHDGKKYYHSIKGWGGDQKSPFGDGTMTSVDHTVINLENGEHMKFSGLLPGMIESYGFYEGKGTGYRLDPMAIAKVAGLISMPSDDPVTQLIKNRDARVVIRTAKQLKLVDALQEAGIDVLSGENHQIIPEDSEAERCHKLLTEPRDKEGDDTDD